MYPHIDSNNKAAYSHTAELWGAGVFPHSTKGRAIAPFILPLFTVASPAVIISITAALCRYLQSRSERAQEQHNALSCREMLENMSKTTNSNAKLINTVRTCSGDPHDLHSTLPLPAGSQPSHAFRYRDAKTPVSARIITPGDRRDRKQRDGLIW